MHYIWRHCVSPVIFMVTPLFSQFSLDFLIPYSPLIKCHKYPPSLLYLLITLGVKILLLYFLEKSEIRHFKPLIVLGEQPLFFYVIHFWLIHITTISLALSRYGITPFTFSQVGISWKPKAFGYDLPIVYLIWLLMTVILIYYL